MMYMVAQLVHSLTYDEKSTGKRRSRVDSQESYAIDVITEKAKLASGLIHKEVTLTKRMTFGM